MEASKKNEAAYMDYLRQEVTKHLLAIRALAQDIRNCMGPQESLLDLNTATREKMSSLRRHLDELDRVARETEREKERTALQSEAAEYRQQLAEIQAEFRRANVSCQLRLEQRDKEWLFESESGDSTTPATRRRNKDSSTVLGTSSAVTADLMAVGRQLEETVNRSALTVEALADSSRTIHTTRDEFHQMGGALGQAKKLLSKYGRRELTDKALIFLAVLFFFACVFYVVKKRLF